MASPPPTPEPAALSTVADDTQEVVRYLGYGGRFRTILVAGSRYLAFTSDVGEAFRPVFPPRLVTGSYAISWLYCGADVALHGYSAWKQGNNSSDITRSVVERSIFQSVASMGLPALTIHTTVRVFSSVFKKVGKYQKWGPTMMGLAVVPFLPIYDHPVEHTLDYLFARFWPKSSETSSSAPEEKKEL
jgi:fission process protein 1